MAICLFASIVPMESVETLKPYNTCVIRRDANGAINYADVITPEKASEAVQEIKSMLKRIKISEHVAK